VQLSQEQASEFYAEHFGKAFFANLISFMGRCARAAVWLAGERREGDFH
jgi:nucleoside diphosphate kinase